MILNKKTSVNLKKYILVGPPNVGKSTLFNKLTWKVSAVSNIDRYTTTINSAKLRKDNNIEIVDLPGVTTFSFTGHDEEITINYILNNDYIGAINIISALSIHRDLMLTIRLAEAGILSNVVVNMCDEFENINIRRMEMKLKVPFTSISAKKNINIPSVIATTKKSPLPKKLFIKYSKKIEQFLNDVANIIGKKKISRRFIFLEALENKEYAINILKKESAYDLFCKKIKEYDISEKDISSIDESRNIFMNEELLKIENKYASINDEGKKYYNKFKKIDNFFLKPWVAIPGFILLMCLIYFITFYEYTGGWIQSQLADNGFGKIQELIIDSISNNTHTTNWLASFVADGILGGIFTVLSFLPWIIILFVCITIIEQIGILSRISMVFDNSLKKFGINGRSLVNIITGIGCNIPGILLSRNISSKKERIISVMISSLVSCSARVVVYGFISNSIIGSQYSWMLSMGITVISILFAILMGGVFSNTLFRHSSSMFLVQIPRWRSIDVVVILRKTVSEIYGFLKRTIIIVGILNLVVWFLMSTGPVKSFILDLDSDEYITNSFLYYLSFPLRYLLYPIGLGFDYRWSISLLSAFPAKEAAASTLETLFGNSSEFKEVLFSEKYSIATIASFLTMFTFYVPCLATVSVMKKEIGWKNTLISIGIILSVTYVLSLLVFVFSATIYNLINNSNYSIASMILLILSLMMILLLSFIHIFRIKLQNNGTSEKISVYLKWKRIYILLITFASLSLVGSTALVFI